MPACRFPDTKRYSVVKQLRCRRRRPRAAFLPLPPRCRLRAQKRRLEGTAARQQPARTADTFLRSSGDFARPRALLRAQNRRLMAKGVREWKRGQEPFPNALWPRPMPKRQLARAGKQHLGEKVPDPFGPQAAAGRKGSRPLCAQANCSQAKTGRRGAGARRFFAPAVVRGQYQAPPLRAKEDGRLPRAAVRSRPRRSRRFALGFIIAVLRT